MSTEPNGDSAPQPRSFADAAALLPSRVPVPAGKPAEVPSAPAAVPAYGSAPFSAAHHGFDPRTFSPPIAPVGKSALPVRRAWLAALTLAAAVCVVVAWRAGVGGRVPAEAVPREEASTAPPPSFGAPAGSAPASISQPPDPAASAENRQPMEAQPGPLLLANQAVADPPSVTPEVATLGSEEMPGAAGAPVPYALVVLHPRPASASGDAANERVAAKLRPLTTQLDMRRPAGPHGRLTVHYFHAEDAAAARALAETVRTPGAPVNLRGPVHTRKTWPPDSFEVWLRGP